MPDADVTSPEFIEQQRQGLIEFFHGFAFFKLMGFQIVDVEPGRATLSMAYRSDLCQPAGIMHGGAIASLVDTAIANAMLLTKEYLEAKVTGATLVSVDLRIKYLRPVSGGTVTCVARALRIGRTITHASAIVTNSAGKEVAHGDSIYMIVPGDRTSGKN